MKPAWNQLGDEFESSKTVLIGDVDCTVHKKVCGKMGVQGYPTIKYFTGATAADGDKYEGGRDFSALQKFAQENLGPSCGADNEDLCNDDQLKLLKEAQALSADDLTAAIETKNAEIAQLEDDFKAGVEKLQAQYQQLMDDKDSAIAAKSPTLKMYRSVLAASKKSGKDEL